MVEQVILTCYLLNRSVSIGERYTRELQIDNQTTKALPALRLVWQESSYNNINSVEVPPIYPNQKKKVSVDCNIKGGVTSNNLESTMIFSYNGTTYRISNTMVDYTGSLLSTRPSPLSLINKINILLFGMAGATKSSFLNSIYTLLNRDQNQIVSRAGVGGAERHNTTSLNRYPLENTSINIWDTWGLTPKNYTGGELEAILRGELPSAGWGMTDSMGNSELRTVLDRSRMTAGEKKIHCVLFFIPQAALSDPNQDKTRKLISENFETISKKGYNPLLLLTRVDEIQGNIRSAPNSFYPEIQELRKKAANLLNIAERRVFYNLNYTTEINRNFEIDKLNYTILCEAVSCGSEYIKSPLSGYNTEYYFTTTTTTINTSQGVRTFEF